MFYTDTVSRRLTTVFGYNKPVKIQSYAGNHIVIILKLCDILETCFFVHYFILLGHYIYFHFAPLPLMARHTSHSL